MARYALSLAQFGKDPMLPALVIAATVHLAVILGVGFSINATEQPARSMAITVALAPGSEPEQAQHIAAFNQQGLEAAGGEMQSQWLPASSMTVSAEPLPEDNQEGRQLSPKQARSDSNPEARYHSQSDSSDIDRSRIGAVAARRSLDAAYLAVWRARVEEVGIMLAEEHRALGDGDVRLLVAIAANGELERIQVLKSSGDRALDRAAQNTVVLAAPFPAFPGDLAKQTSELTIVRTWQFRTTKERRNPS